MSQSHAWLVYVFSPSVFRCLRCGATSLYTLPKDIVTFVAAFKEWAGPHLSCREGA